MCNRIQATRQQRSGITWRKKKKTQNNNKQAKKRRKKKTKIRRGRRQKKETEEEKEKEEEGKKERTLLEKKGLVKIWGSNFYRHFLEKKKLFFWAFFEILRQKYVHLARALPYITIFLGLF